MSSEVVAVPKEIDWNARLPLILVPIWFAITRFATDPAFKSSTPPTTIGGKQIVGANRIGCGIVDEDAELEVGHGLRSGLVRADQIVRDPLLSAHNITIRCLQPDDLHTDVITRNHVAGQGADDVVGCGVVDQDAVELGRSGFARSAWGSHLPSRLVPM